ncbi:ImmA/IrrE family metallo-endopeptidase [Bacillus sp. JJ722]|uniref:ImmA/IrrE family metallo-endopeptidase n=1 Tax=Bacillus sp. JJ722 TaxID=3122973 RepID=UPI002FFFFA48
MGKDELRTVHAEIVGEAFALQALNSYFGADVFIGASVEIKLQEIATLIYQNISDTSYHGATITNKETGKVYVSLNTNQSLRKRYFTAAHELWHVLQIKDLIDAKINEERAAERFAAALILPASLMKLLWDDVQKEDMEKQVILIADMSSAPYVSVAKRVVELGLVKDNKSKKGLLAENKNEKYWVELREQLGISHSPLDDAYRFSSFKKYEDVLLKSIENKELGVVEVSTKLAHVSPKLGSKLYESWVDEVRKEELVEDYDD